MFDVRRSTLDCRGWARLSGRPVLGSRPEPRRHNDVADLDLRVDRARHRSSGAHSPRGPSRRRPKVRRPGCFRSVSQDTAVVRSPGFNDHDRDPQAEGRVAAARADLRFSADAPDREPAEPDLHHAVRRAAYAVAERARSDVRLVADRRSGRAPALGPARGAPTAAACRDRPRGDHHGRFRRPRGSGGRSAATPRVA